MGRGRCRAAPLRGQELRRYRGASFLVLPDELLAYEDTQETRVSSAAARQEAEVAAVRWRLWLRRPADPAVPRAPLHATVTAARYRLRGG